MEDKPLMNPDYTDLDRKELEELTNELRAERNSLVLKLEKLDEEICESLSYSAVDSFFKIKKRKAKNGSK